METQKRSVRGTIYIPGTSLMRLSSSYEMSPHIVTLTVRWIVPTGLISLETPDFATSNWLKKSPTFWVSLCDTSYKIFTLQGQDMIGITGLLELSLPGSGGPRPY